MKNLFWSVIFLFISCSIKQEPIHLPGQIAIQKDDSTIFVYLNGEEKSIFHIKEKPPSFYAEFTWIHQKDALLTVHYFDSILTGNYNTIIQEINLKGEVVSNVYESQKSEILGSAYLSPNDKFLLFTSDKKRPITDDPVEGLRRKRTFKIMDYSHKQIIQEVTNVGLNNSIQIYESPWINDESKFIYEYRTDRKVILENESIEQDTAHADIYIYNLQTKMSKLLIKEGKLGVCSPVNSQIAYIKDNSVCLFDLNSSATSTIFHYTSNCSIHSLHWTPEGKNLYVLYFDKKKDMEVEMLINVERKTEQLFYKLNHGFFPYSWK